jgi:NOL1/NOP2/fmu family ribosome biogenesis protein
VAVAEQRGERFEPLYGSAILPSSDLKARLEIELDDDQAARYVAGEAIRFSSTANGWCRIGWRGRPLAWGKLAGGVLKNHYPKAMRQARHA